MHLKSLGHVPLVTFSDLHTVCEKFRLKPDFQVGVCVGFANELKNLTPMLNVFGYVFTDRLGKGTYGEVFKAINQKNRSICAVKRISKKSLCKKAQDNLVEEIGILKNLHHRNIVSMMDFTWDSEYVYIFMEYLGGGDLSSFLKTEKRLSERTIRYFLQQLAFALHYLYERNIVHMDIKPQNILLTNSTPPILKLADFGFAKSMGETMKMNEVRGSLLYLAPEIYKYGVYDKSCDLWSVGIILYQCLFGKTPFHCNSKEGVKAKLLEDTPIPIPDCSTYSTDCIDLLSKLLKRRPSERINHDQFFIHPFIDLSHAPCPLSIYKAVKHITLGDELLEKGDIFDAYVNYKEGLTHLMFALQVESDSSRRKIMRSKTCHGKKGNNYLGEIACWQNRSTHSEDLMADNTITSEMKRHAAIVSIKAKYRNLEVARFLKVSRSFVYKVRKDLMNENNEDELTATRKKKEYCQRSAD
ncbi:hypothetical protein ACTXT7_004680 [Hymenolepis weldensis]